MGAIWTPPTSLYRPPVGPADIAPEWIESGLVRAYSFHTGQLSESVTRELLGVDLSAAQYGYGRNGGELQLNSLSGTTEITDNALAGDQSAISVVLVTTPIQRSSSDFMFGRFVANKSADLYNWGLYWGGSGSQAYLRTADGNASSTSSASFSTGQLQTMGLTWDGVTLRGFLGGKEHSSNTRIGTLYTGTGSKSNAFQGWTTGSTIRHNPQIALLFDQDIGADAQLELHNNPWQIFKPRASRTIFLSTGGGTTITASTVAQGQTIGEVTLTQSHVLQPDGISQSQGAGSLTLTQAHVLPPDSISQAQTAGSVTLTQAHIIVPAGIAQQQSAGSPDLTQEHTLTPDGLAQTQTAGQVTLTAAGTLLIDGLTQATGLSAVDLVQAGVLSIHGISQEQSVAEIDLTQAHALVPAGLTQQQTAGSPSLTQAHQLAINGLVQAQTVEQAVTAVEDLLSIDGLTQAQGIDSASLTQHYTITPDGLTQAQALQAVTFGGLVVGSLQGKIRIYALYDGDINITPALTGKITIH